MIAAIGLTPTIGTSAVAVVPSNTRLYDKVENVDGRLKVVEAGRSVSIPRLDKREAENKQQNDRISAIAEASGDEGETPTLPKRARLSRTSRR